MAQNKSHCHDSGIGGKSPKWENKGKEENLPMLGHVISLLSALVGIIGIINDSLGKHK